LDRGAFPFHSLVVIGYDDRQVTRSGLVFDFSDQFGVKRVFYIGYNNTNSITVSPF
jgi:hypothetical protein